MKAKYFLGGVEINEPNNYPELSIELNYDKNSNKEAVSINNWVFGVNDLRYSNDGVGGIKTVIDDGLISGVGVTEGHPFKIVLDDELGTNYNVFDGYVDIWKSKVLCDQIIAPAVEQGKIDWLNDTVDSFGFKFLYDSGFFSSDYFVPVPYCIQKKQNGYEIVMSLLSVFVITQAIKAQIVSLQEKVTASTNPFQSATAIIGIVLQIGYIVTLFIALIQLYIDLFYLLVQPIKYHNGMYAKDLLEIGLSYLGLKLSSSILQQFPYNKMLIMPEKFNLKQLNTGKFKYVVGQLIPDKNEKEGFYKGTFGDLLRALIGEFDAKIIIDNGTLYFEKQDFQLKPAQYSLPDLVDTGYEFNWDEFYSNYKLSFATDQNDRNTIQEYAGTAYQVIQSQSTSNNAKMQLMRNIKVVDIPFALAKRKTELNFIEEIFNVFFQYIGTAIDIVVAIDNEIIKVLNSIIKTLNKVIKALKTVGINLGSGIPSIPLINISSIANLIENRIDMMVMESDFISVPKMLLVDDHTNKRNNKLLANNETYLNARWLFDNYHYFNNFAETNGWSNQYKKYSFENIPFTFSDYEKVRSNNSIFKDGKEGSLISLKYNPIAQTASGSVKIKEVYTNNIKITNIYPNE